MENSANHCNKPQYVLTVSCPDTNGIVREVSDFLYTQGASIFEAAQHRDALENQFFMRVEFEEANTPLPDLAALNQKFATLADKFSMQWQFTDQRIKPRVLVAVSKHGHCLNDILHRWDSGVLAADIVGVVSNHEDMASMVEWHGLPFYYLPVTAETKESQEGEIVKLIDELKVDLFVLARYMQILSSNLCAKLSGKAINIHHSFLPGFKGADPYRQAYKRGVKIIGATAHYVTADLDEGPIIEQAVEKIDHNCDIEALRQIGRDAECAAFARAIKWHCEQRIIINGNRTVVFK